MKNLFRFLRLLTLLFVISCNPESSKPIIVNHSNPPADNSDSVEIKRLIREYDFNRSDSFNVGDVNADGRKDIAIVQPPALFYQHANMDSQFVYIKFSCDVPAIKHFDGFHGLIADLPDLDGNHTNEILYLPDWYQSNDALFYIYGFENSTWKLFATGSIRRDILRVQDDPIAFLRKRVQKVKNNVFKLTEHVLLDTDFVDSTRLVVLHS